MIHLEKWHAKRAVTAVYYEGEKEDWYVKRFLPELTQKPFSFIGDHDQSRLGVVSTDHHPMVRIRFNRRFKETRDREDEIIDACEFISVKGGRALGNRLNALPVTEVVLEPKDVERELLAEKEWLGSVGGSTSETTSESISESAPESTEASPVKANSEALPVKPSSEQSSSQAQEKSASRSEEKNNQTGAEDDSAQPTLF
ncbi:MAG: hypothetical protein HOH92_07475 [Crocinitomicaceae bacterium]|nr:hypothetical protein [Crocinitomicaceae bacterium]